MIERHYIRVNVLSHKGMLNVYVLSTTPFKNVATNFQHESGIVQMKKLLSINATILCEWVNCETNFKGKLRICYLYCLLLSHA